MLPDVGGVAETEADHVDDAEKQRPMVDAIREVPRFEGSDLPFPARGVQKRRVFRQFAPPTARHGGELLGPRTEKADQALHAWLRKATQKNLGQGGRELTVRAI